MLKKEIALQTLLAQKPEGELSGTQPAGGNGVEGGPPRIPIGGKPGNPRDSSVDSSDKDNRMWDEIRKRK